MGFSQLRAALIIALAISLLASPAALAMGGTPAPAAGGSDGGASASPTALIARRGVARHASRLKRRPPVSLPRRRRRGRGLPRTGAEPGLLIVAGVGLMLCGIGLRLRLRESPGPR